MPVIRYLVWDEQNTTHIAGHGVILEEVEEVCRGQPVFRDSYKGRILVIGPTLSGRMITAVLDPEPGLEGAYYPVTARPASRRERRRYSEEKQGTEG